LSQGIAPDNFIDPAGLNNLQRRMLKESFTAINRLQELIQYRYQTQLLPGS
jgi:CBS domain-containing protein